MLFILKLTYPKWPCLCLFVAATYCCKSISIGRQKFGSRCSEYGDHHFLILSMVFYRKSLWHAHIINTSILTGAEDAAVVVAGVAAALV